MRNEAPVSGLDRLIIEHFKVALNEVLDEREARQPVQMMTMKEKRSRRLDIGQTAKYMNRSRSTIDRWRKSKPEFKVLEHIDGTSTYFLTNELDEYLNQ